MANSSAFGIKSISVLKESVTSDMDQMLQQHFLYIGNGGNYYISSVWLRSFSDT